MGPVELSAIGNLDDLSTIATAIMNEKPNTNVRLLFTLPDPITMEEMERRLASAEKGWEAIIQDPLKSSVVFFNGDEISIEFIHPQAITSGIAILALFNVLDRHPEIKTLSILHCDFDEGAWADFMDCFLNSKHMTGIVISACGVNESQWKKSMNGFASHKDKLIKLVINEMLMSEQAVRALTGFLKNNQVIAQLSLNKCDLVDSDIRRIGKALKGNKSLKILDLTKNHFTDVGAAYLAHLIADHPALQRVALLDNQIGDAGAIALGNALGQKEGFPLVDLGLQRNKISDKGACHLVKWGTRLVSIGLQENEQLKTLKVLEKSFKNPSLTGISLVGTGISPSVFIAFLNRRKFQVIEGRKLTIFFNVALDNSKKLALEASFKGTGVEFLFIDPSNKRKSEIDEFIRIIEQHKEPTQELLDAIQWLSSVGWQEVCFEHLLKKCFRVVNIPPNGNCLFASLAYGSPEALLVEGPLRTLVIKSMNQEYADERIYAYIEVMVGRRRTDVTEDEMRRFIRIYAKAMRETIVDYMEQHAEEYQWFILEEDAPGEDTAIRFKEYCANMRQEVPVGLEDQFVKRWGGQLEIRAFTEIFQKAIKIFDLKMPIKIQNGTFETADELFNGQEFANKGIVYVHRLNQDHYNILFEKKRDTL